MLLEAIYDFFFDRDLFNRFLVANGYVPFTIVVSYIVFTEYLGPQIMKEREPFGLQKLMIGYNFFLAAINLYLAYSGLKSVLRYYPDLSCRMTESPRFPDFVEEMSLFGWHIYLVKLTELFDTVIFILRKKFGQVSFLHVFHHSAVVTLVWLLIKTKFVGFYLLILIPMNSLIHVIMYSYYGLTAFGPHMQKYLWWKKHLTKIQIAQFLITMIYMIRGFATGCEKTGVMEISFFIAIFSFAVLFLNFYIQTFKKKK